MLLIVLNEVGRGIHQPYVESFVQEQVASSYRATYGSLQSFLGSLGMVATLLLSAWYLRLHDGDASAILSLWVMVGGLGILLSLFFWRVRPR